jgi:hypothetical protein
MPMTYASTALFVVRQGWILSYTEEEYFFGLGQILHCSQPSMHVTTYTAPIIDPTSTIINTSAVIALNR